MTGSLKNMRACCGCCWWWKDGYEICSCHANFNVYVDPAAPPWPLFPTSWVCSSLLLPLGWQCSLALIDRWWPACVLLHCRCESNLFTLWMAGRKPKMNYNLFLAALKDRKRLTGSRLCFTASGPRIFLWNSPFCTTFAQTDSHTSTSSLSELPLKSLEAKTEDFPDVLARLPKTGRDKH